jgi:hypothetical protein
MKKKFKNCFEILAEAAKNGQLIKVTPRGNDRQSRKQARILQQAINFQLSDPSVLCQMLEDVAKSLANKIIIGY